MIVGDMLRHARAAGFANMSLVAVNGSLPFWHKHGFRPVAAPELADKLRELRGGGALHGRDPGLACL